MWISLNEAARIAFAAIILVLHLPVPTVVAITESIITSQDGQDIYPLERGKPIQRDLPGGQAHQYRVTLWSAEYLHAFVYQRGIDVEVTLFGPDDKALVKVNNLDGTQVPEQLFFVAEVTGAYRLEVRSPYEYARAGRYEVRVEELRAATEQDKSRVAADRAFMAGEQLRTEQTSESLTSAIKKYEEALSLWRGLGDQNREAQTLHRIGLAHSFIGDQQVALEFYNRAYALMKAEGDRLGQAYTLTDIGRVYYVLGEREKALESYYESLPLMRAARDPAGEAVTLNRMGVIYASLQERHKALELHNLALPLMRSVSNRNGEAYTLAHIGWLQHFLGDERKALEYHTQALSIIESTGDRDGIAYMLANLAATHHHLGDAQKALDYYSRALELCRPTGNRAGYALLLYKTARVHYHRGDLVEARTNIEAALRIIESLRTNIGSGQLRTSYSSAVQEYYEFYVELLMRLHRRSPSEGFDAAAFESSEHARARSLLELLVEARADIRHGIDPLLVEKERYLHRQLNTEAESERRLLSASHTQEQAAGMAKEIEALVTQYQEVWDEIRARSPHYAALAQPQALSLREIQQQVLDPDTLLLEYWLGKERSYLWAVSRTSITSYELPKSAEIDAAAHRFYDLLTAAQRNRNETVSQYSARVAKADAEYPAAAALSRMLLEPASSQLAGKRLLIVTHGSLDFVPFAALQETRAQGNRSARGVQVPLVFEHEIVNSPSASTLAVLRRETAGREPAARAVAVLADPVFDKEDSRIRLRTNDSKGAASNQSCHTDLKYAIRDVASPGGKGRLSRLPFSRDEAKSILNLVPPEQSLKAIDFQANREMATSAELSRYRIVHFATHGLLNSKHPELSGIVLSLVDERGEPQDGFLRLHEIYNLSLPAELVVLSACRTGLGKQVKGEGLIGLTRGFMYAGAKLVMASLWNISDSVTPELMKHFYEGMFLKGLKPAAALRAAQIQMWKTKHRQSPYYWAAFVLQGDWR